MKTIPQQVKEQAESLGNNVNYVGEYNGEELYSVETLDKHGYPQPTGMPIFVFFNGTHARVQISEENISILASLFKD